MSFTFVTVFIGCRAASNSSLRSGCMGDSTTPGATALNRIPSFAYSIARLRVTALKPPFVIIETDALIPAMG